MFAQSTSTLKICAGTLSTSQSGSYSGWPDAKKAGSLLLAAGGSMLVMTTHLWRAPRSRR